MRPDPHQRQNAPHSGRIIYIGDVRRRRGPRRTTPDRYYLVVFALVAAMSWGAWLTVVMSLAPSRLLSYVAFLIPLGLALVTTGTIGFYAVQWWRGELPDLRACFRWALLTAAVVEVNLGFLGAHRWAIPVGAVSVAAAIMAEVAIRARRAA